MFINNLEIRQITTLPNYGVSCCGRVFRLKSHKEMKRYPSGRSGYLAFRACHNNKATTEYIHKCVALAWITNDDPDNKCWVNHKDGNKLNNQADNLEWVTLSQNTQHAIQNNLISRGMNKYNASITDEQAHKVCQLLEDGWQVKDIADTLDIKRDQVRHLRSGSTFFHIRVCYNIDYEFKNTFSENTVRWVCESIVRGLSDINISKQSKNKHLTPIEVKRIRRKIRYSLISNEYF